VQPSGTQDIERLRGYFQFKARGIPRRLLFELNSMVRWVGGRPQIRLDALDRLRVEFYARLNDVLESYIREQVDVDDEAERHGVEHDRFRLGAHYVIDWVLRSEGAVFVATDLIQGRRALSSLLDLAEADVAVLLEHLATEHILDRLNEPQSLFTTFIAGSPTTGLTRYRLDSGIRDELKQLTQGNRRERADLLGDAGFGSQSGANGGYSSGTGSTGYPPSSYLLPPPTTAPYAPPPPTAPYAPPPSPGTPFAPPPAPAAPSAPSWDDVPPAPASPYVTAVPYGTAPAASETAAANFTVPRDEQFVGQGRYQLLDVIGTGGMGMVYRARVVGTDQQVAVKMLPPWAVQDSGLRQRFLRETETSRSLQVPGVVATLDVLDEPGGRLGIVMELAEGTTLQRIADDGTCSPAEAVRIVAELLATVARLHAHGLVRLDIKPSNIVLDPERHPIVLDLGLAKPAMAAALSQTTNEGDYVGTPAFSAPEQLRGEAVDQRVDIYACGCVLFQLFGGDLAQGGADVFALMHRRISQAHLPVEDLTCSPELRTVIATATAQRPEHRFQSADAFREKLVAVPEATAEERPVREVPSIVE
jgi:serine/threonine-protein kinase